MKTIIKNASQLVTCSGIGPKKGKFMNDLSIIDDGAIYIEDGIIKDIGKNRHILEKYNDVEDIIDAENKAVLPAFIDSHTHLVFGGNREQEFSMRVNGESYMQIMKNGGGIQNSVNRTREATFDELYKKSQKAINSMVSFGVGTIEAKSGYGLDFDTEIKQLKVSKKLNEDNDIDIYSTFLGAHSFPPQFKGGKENEYVDFLIDEMLPFVKRENLAEFCDVFVEKNVFSIEQGRKILLKAKELGFKLKIHADEIVCLDGAKLAGEVGCVSADHLLMSSDDGIKSLIENGVVATLLPITAFSLKENFARARYIIDNGGAVALATDYNPGSCFSENISLAISIACIYMGMSIEEAITAVTINGACAIKKEKEIGSLDVGKYADIIILDEKDYRFIPYHIGVSSVNTVIKKGKIIFKKHIN